MFFVQKKPKSYPKIVSFMSKPINHPQIIALLDGDEGTMRLLYDTLYPKIRSFIYKNRGTDTDTEEVFHNALFQLIARANVQHIQINTSFEAYFFTICKNLWYKELNKRKKEVRNEGVFELKDEVEANYHVESILYQDRYDLFEELFLKLSDNCQKLLKDYFDNVPYDAIIQKFSYATKNVAFQRIFKCKKRLTELIKMDSRFKNL